MIADSQPAAAATNDFNRAVSTSGSVAAHLSAVTSSVFPFLSPPPPPFSAPAVPLWPVLSMQGLVSFAEPQHIKGIPGDVEVTSVSPGYKVFFYSVSSERAEQRLLLLLLPGQQTGTKLVSRVLVEPV